MTTLSNLAFIGGEYIVSTSNPSGLLTVASPTTQNYVFSYGVNIATSRIHNFTSTIGDTTSNISVSLNGSNLAVSTSTSNLFSTLIPSTYLVTGYNTVYVNRLENRLIVAINGSNIVRITNSNLLPQTYNNSTLTITASNSTKFNNVVLQPTAITTTPMDFLQPIKATTITCSNVSACNLDILTSNLSASSNTAYWSSNNLLNKSGGTVNNYLQMSSNGGNALLGSSGSNGSYLSLLQGANLMNSSSNFVYYGLGCSGLGQVNLQGYGGLTLGDNAFTTVYIKATNVGVGVSNPSYKLDVNGTVNATSYVGSTITNLSNLGVFGSNTATSASNVAISLSNQVYGTIFSSISTAQSSATFASNASVFGSNTSTSASNIVTSLSNVVYGTTATSIATAQATATFASNASVFGSNTAISASNTVTSLSNLVYGTTATSIATAQATATFASNASVFGSNTVVSASNTSIWSSNTALYGSNVVVSLSNFTYSNVSLLSNNLSAVAISLSNTSNSVVAFSNYETSRINSLSNYAYNLSTSNSTVTNIYTSNISASSGTIGSLVMSGAGLALGGYNLLNGSGFLTNALKDSASGLKINIDPSAGSMSSLSLLSKFSQFTDSVMVGVSTIELSNNAIYFKNSNTSNTVYTSNAINILNSAISNFTISNANIVTNCNIVSPTITTLSNIAYYASNNLLSKSGGTINGSLYVSACNGGVYLGVTSNQGSFVSVNQGATMMTSDSNWPAYGLGCSSTGKVNLQGYFGLSFGDNINTTMTIAGNNLGIGTITPSSKLDVVGNVSATSFSGSTITNLSNMGLFGSNASVYGSNTAVFGSNTLISLSNQVFGSTTTNITNAQVTANFGSNYSVFSSNASVYGSNTAVFSSNAVISLSNQVFGSTTTNITNAQNTANFSSNTGVSASNTSVWSSNNLLNKSGGTIQNFLQMSSNGGNALLGSSGSNGSYLSLLQGANMYNASSNFVYYGLGCSGLGQVNLQGYGGLTLGDNSVTTLFIKATNVGIGVSNPSYKLDVSGTANVTGNITSPTITSLSNLGMYSSNTSGYSSNTTVSLSNYIYTTSTTNISAVQSTATFGSNTSVFSSNLSVITSNSLISLSNSYNTNITNAQSTASFGSNTSVWSSNNLLSKSGDTMVGSLLLQSGAILSNSTALSSKTNTGAIQALVSLDGGNSVRYSGGSNTGTVYLNPDLNCTTQINYNNSNNTTIWYGGSAVLTQSLGNIGIGMTSPSYKLDVSGTIRATTYILPTAGWITSADNKNRIYYATNDRTYYGSVNGHEWRSSNDTNIMNLTDGGSLAVLSSATLGNALLSNVNSSNCGMVHSALGGNTHSNYSIKQDSAGLTTINCAQNQAIEFRYNNTPQCYMTSNLFNVGQTLNANNITSTYQTTYSSAITNLTANSVTVGGGTQINHMKIYPISIGSSGAVLVTYTLSGTFPSSCSVFMTFYNQGVNDLFSYTIKSKSTSSIVIVIERTNGGTWATNLQADILVVGY